MPTAPSFPTTLCHNSLAIRQRAIILLALSPVTAYYRYFIVLKPFLPGSRSVSLSLVTAIPSLVDGRDGETLRRLLRPDLSLPLRLVPAGNKDGSVRVCTAHNVPVSRCDVDARYIRGTVTGRRSQTALRGQD